MSLDPEAGFLVECHVADAQGLAVARLSRLAKPPVGRRLPRRVTIEGDVAFQQSAAIDRCRAIAHLDYQIEDHAAPAGGQVELVAVFGIAAAFDDDIGMGLEQADQLVASRQPTRRPNPAAHSV